MSSSYYSKEPPHLIRLTATNSKKERKNKNKNQANNFGDQILIRATVDHFKA
jgi:hypothetical protein